MLCYKNGQSMRGSTMFRALGMLYMALTLIEGRSIKQEATKEPFELADFLRSRFSAKSFNGTWVTDDTLIYKNSTGDIVLFDLSTKNSIQFLDKSVLDDYYPGASISVSPDQLYILIRYNVSTVFRHSTTALYATYDVSSNTYYDIAGANHLQIALWSPVGHGLVYVYLNNLYYLENPRESAEAITSDGVPREIYNGVPDWVYEEEILGSGSAFWFSPDGNKIIFASFNDVNVSQFTYFTYGSPGDLKDQYPSRVDITYPKAGTTNPTVKTFIANLKETPVVPIEIQMIPERFLEEDFILYDMKWVTNEEFVVIFTNRIQNSGELVRCKTDGSCKQEATYEEPKGWLEVSIPIYNKAGTQRIEILPQPEGDDFFEHLVLTDVKTTVARRLTKGSFVVLAVYGWDEDSDAVYFLGTRKNQHSQRHVYEVRTATSEIKCLTCDMNTSMGLCKYSAAFFSKNFSYIAKICQGPGPYLVEIHSVKNESDVFVWEDNKDLVDKLALKQLPVIKDLKVEVDGGFEANVRLLLPPSLNENSTKKYPAVVNVYGGPNSNQITDAYSSGFQNYIVTNREYIYIYIDGRGSGKNGKNKMFQIYRRLGTVEVQDQISVTKHLQDNFSYIDAEKTGIWGWSYGGFATAWALVRDRNNVFKFGLSVAPVTAFIYYDSIYTERYMGLPIGDNLLNYNNTDVTRRVEFMRDKLFFLIHGNADDNVHYQQSMLLSKALELADIPFRQQSYPDENHSLGHVYPHLYHTIDRFWARSFDLPDPPA